MDEIDNGNEKLTLSAVLLIAMISMSFGANAVAIKISLKGIGAFTVAGLRFSIAAFAIIVWALFTGRPLGIEKGSVFAVIVDHCRPEIK